MNQHTGNQRTGQTRASLGDGMVPAQKNYRMPAEWEPHAATWLAWPHNPETWPGAFAPIPAVWQRLVEIIASSEPVHILAGGSEVRAVAERHVGHLSNVTLHDVATNDCWIRDYGPTFLTSDVEQPPALVDWGYNAWGGKYPPFDLDDRVPRILAEQLQRCRFDPGIILEGGSIDVDGRGTLLTTEQCLLHPNRNPGHSREEIEARLHDYLGVRRVLWLGQGIEGDDTDGHVDDLARFVAPGRVVTVVEDDPADANYRPLRDNLERLRTMCDAEGRPLDVVTLPMPRPLFHGSQRMPASYANFYIGNQVVAVPVFDDPADEQALKTLAEVFPDRRIEPLRAVDMVWGLGACHCVTQQEPRSMMPL